MFRVHHLSHTLVFLLCLLSLGSVSFGQDNDDSSPINAIDAVVQGVLEYQPGVVWDCLPASYQKDVKDLLSLFSSKMDAGLYNKGVSLAIKSVNIMKTKKEFILNYGMIAAALPDAISIGEDWDKVIELFEIMVKSDLRSLESIKNMDVKNFLNNTVGNAMRNASDISKTTSSDFINNEFIKKLKGTTFQVASSKDGIVTVKFTTESKVDKLTPFQKVEGKWIPLSIKSKWRSGVDELIRTLDVLGSDEMKEVKSVQMQWMNQIEGILDQLSSVKSQAAFNVVLSKLMLTQMKR